MALSIGKAWDDTKLALAKNRRLIVPVALGLVLIPAVVSAMVEPRAVPGQQPEAGAWMWVTLVMIIVMLAGQMAIALLTNGWQGSVGQAIGRAVRRLPTLMLAALMVMVPLILLMSVILGLVGMSSGGASFSAQSLTPTGWLVILIGLLVVLAVGVRLLPLVVIVASEEVGPIAAIKRAFALTRGHFWKLLAFMLLATVAFLIVAAAAGAVVGSIISLTVGTPEPWSVSLLLVALVAGLVQTAFITIYTAMLARVTAQLAEPQASVPST